MMVLKHSMLAWVFLMGMVCAPAAQEAPAPEDLLTLAKGAVLVSASVKPTEALALTDGDDESNWSTSTRRTPPPYSFVFELAAPAQLRQLGIDGAGLRPGGVQGGSVGPLRVEGSAEGPETGYVELARLTAASEGPTLANVAPDAPQVRWLRFTIEGGQTPDVPWIYFDEVLAYGAMTPPSGPDRFTGVFKVGRVNFVELVQDGGSITGCYVENSGLSGGIVTGAVVDGVALLNWTSDTDIRGTAFLTIDSTGALFGVRYRDRSRSVWAGPLVADATTPCSAAPASNPILDALKADGFARLYGIHFEHNSDVPKASAGPALEALLEALNTAPDLAIRIDGHTDADGSDDYNLDLSDRRAASVMAWLTERGIDRARLSSAGQGEAQPVASNATADGKALNRRVEIVGQL